MGVVKGTDLDVEEWTTEMDEDILHYPTYDKKQNLKHQINKHNWYTPPKKKPKKNPKARPPPPKKKPHIA